MTLHYLTVWLSLVGGVRETWPRQLQRSEQPEMDEHYDCLRSCSTASHRSAATKSAATPTAPPTNTVRHPAPRPASMSDALSPTIQQSGKSSAYSRAARRNMPGLGL